MAITHILNQPWYFIHDYTGMRGNIYDSNHEPVVCNVESGDGMSGGTKNMIETMEALKKPFYVHSL
jgi:hypothetical protein